MSSKVDIVRKHHEETFTNPPASAREATKKYFSEDFQGLDKNGNVMFNKATYLAMSSLLFEAFTGFRGVVHDIREKDGKVLLTFHFEGTHTGDLDLSAMGMGVIPASGKQFKTSESQSWFMVEGDKIVGTQPISGGFELILADLGVTMPPG